ncbi:MAG: hypothetical protein KDC80_02840 [Saprospiraceae bacterium]|nr:hypothetical protein [Saprospiraceae bacterium]
MRLYRHERIPQFYSSSIFTQVCETGECKPVSIILFWDLLGNYLRYALPDGQLLTKLDHIPFTPEDYKKFEKILADPYSVLENFAIEELTGSREKARIDEIDGITGATPKSISNSIVEGAVYTCYTIWHLAHGSISGHIATITDSIATSGWMLNEFIKSEDIDLRYWATKKLLGQPEKYPDEVRNLITSFDSTDIFGIKNLLSELPDDLLHQSWVQEHLWHQYEKYNFSLQKLLLEKYQRIPVDRHLKRYILSLAAKGNHRQQQLFNSLVFKPE